MAANQHIDFNNMMMTMVGIVIHDNDGCNAANDGKNKMMIDMVQNSNRRRPPQINGS